MEQDVARRLFGGNAIVTVLKVAKKDSVTLLTDAKDAKKPVSAMSATVTGVSPKKEKNGEKNERQKSGFFRQDLMSAEQDYPDMQKVLRLMG